MTRFITLILMLTTLLTFAQKVTAFAPLLENKTDSMVNCSMAISLKQLSMDKTACNGNEMPQTMNCQSDCDVMTVVSELYFSDDDHGVSQPLSKLAYQTSSAGAPYYFPESLYRPPFLS